MSAKRGVQGDAKGPPAKKVRRGVTGKAGEDVAAADEEPLLDAKINTSMLVCEAKHSVVALTNVSTHYGCRSLAVSADSVVAVLGSNDRGESDWILFQDALADPYGEPSAPLTCIDVADKREGHGMRINSVSAYIAATIYAPQQEWRVQALSWGPVLHSECAANVVPLAILTVDGRVGVIFAKRGPRKVVVEDKVTFIDLLDEDFATSISWRPSPFRKAAGAERWGFLAVGTTCGRISQWRMRAPLADRPAQPRLLQRTRDDGVPVIALEWVTADSGAFQDNIVVLRRDSSVMVWKCETVESTYKMTPTHKVVGETELPPSCPQVACVVQGGQLRVFFGQSTSLVCLVLNEKGAADEVSSMIQTIHRTPITGIIACVDWVATIGGDGRLVAYNVEGGGIADLGCDGVGQPPPSEGFGIEINNVLPLTPTAIAFLPTASTLLLLQVQHNREANVNKVRDTHRITPVHLFAAANPGSQMRGIIRNAQSGKFGTTGECLSVGGLLSVVAAVVHSTELRQSFGDDWYAAVQVVLDAYRLRAAAGAPMSELVAYLRLASSVCQQLSPWVTASLPVTPDFAFPARTPSASLAAIRIEIVRCFARANLTRLTQDQEKAALASTAERAAATAGVHFLTCMAARAAGIWVPSYADLEEKVDTAGDKASRSRQKFACTAVKLTPDAKAARVGEDIQRLTKDLALARVVAHGYQVKRFQPAVTRIKTALDQIREACESATDKEWILPQPGQAEVDDWAKMIEGDLKATRPCQLSGCDAQVHTNLASRPLVGICENGHLSQACPLTLLPLALACTGQHPVCMSCGAAQSSPVGYGCLPHATARAESDAPPQFWWVDPTEHTGCLMCGYRLMADD